MLLTSYENIVVLEIVTQISFDLDILCSYLKQNMLYTV